MKMKRRAKENKILKRWNHREVQMIKESQRESSQRWRVRIKRNKERKNHQKRMKKSLKMSV